MKAVVFAYSNVGDRCLRVLRARGVEVPLVVTHRDAPGEAIWFARVADTAAELGLRVVHGDDPNDPALRESVAAARPDAIFSFYFRSLLPPALLALAPRGTFNMHGSLLPQYRGRAPTNWAIVRGETETGATLHEMIARADAGRIVDQQAVPILPDDTGQQVFDKVTVAAEQVLWRSTPAIAAGAVRWRPNDIARGSYFGKRTPEDGRIDWSLPAAQVYDLVRAVAPPYPGAFTDVAGMRLVIGAARRSPLPAGVRGPAGAPGLHVRDGEIVGVCGDGGELAIRQLLVADRPVAAAELQALLASRETATHGIA
ncbi:MAG TPA: formyltransferase [Caldimonas sp.]|jgi:methionyl-tRNA formyltransferase|nr:formyltransferase [Caldimonas sp.]HEV7576825.1 formyltransferase [Caldimonas sp.]